MATKIHTTVTGHRIELDPPPKVAAFLRRIEEMVDDPGVTERELVGLAYSSENPMLDQRMFPSRGAVTPKVLEDPAYAVMTDLIFRKRIAQDGVDVEKLAAKYSMTVAEAAAELGIHESAVRQAIAAKRLASWLKEGRHFIDPRALASFEVGARGPKKREPAPLEIVMGHAKGASLKVKSHEPVVPIERVGGNVVRGKLERWKRVVVMTSGEGGSKRAFVLDASDEENELKFGQFSVRGRFVVKDKANSAKGAEQLWDVHEVA